MESPSLTLTQAIVARQVIRHSDRSARLHALLDESHEAALRPEQVRELAIRLELHPRDPHGACDVCEALASCLWRLSSEMPLL
jgi:hypothetical protein